MKRVILAATLALIAASGSATAQTKRIAIASFGEHPALQGVVDGFKAKMKDLGYAESTLR